MDTLDLQKRIKTLIRELGWSQNQLAREIYTVRNDFDDNDEIKKFEDVVKKQLSRKTTPPELLQGYLNMIYQHPQFDNQKKVFHEYIEGDLLPVDVSEHLREISLSITEELLEEQSDLMEDYHVQGE